MDVLIYNEKDLEKVKNKITINNALNYSEFEFDKNPTIDNENKQDGNENNG